MKAFDKFFNTTSAADGGNSSTEQAADRNRALTDTVYAGILREDQDPLADHVNAGRSAGDLALCGPHMLLTGLTGQGKGRRVIMPGIIRWGNRPVIAMSTKGDLVEGTIRKRAQRGPVYLLDLSNEVQPEELHGIDVTRVISDPCVLVHNDDEASQMADLLQATAKVSSGSGGSGGGGDNFWENNAARPLAAFIRAGSREIRDPNTGQLLPGGITWVLDALDNPPSDSDLENWSSEDVPDLVTPSWEAAYYRASLLGSRNAQALLGIAKQKAAQRDSMAMNGRVALKAWSLSTVAGNGNEAPFVPAMLEQPGATLYIISPMDGGAASAACAVIEQTIEWWRRGISRKLPMLGMFLDELAQCAPLPKLAAHISVLRGYNVRMLVAVQSTKQFKRSHGEAGREELLDTFPSILILPGTPERELLEQASWMAGEDERVTSSTDAYGRASRSTERVARVTAADLLPRKKGTGRLLLGSHPGVLVDLPDISATDLQD